jgi:hypothetical protein
MLYPPQIEDKKTLRAEKLEGLHPFFFTLEGRLFLQTPRGD